MDAAALEKRLEALTEEVGGTYDAEALATRKHWRALVRAYLFWVDCSATPDFLDSQYVAHDIRGYKKDGGNSPNFNLLLKLVFRNSLEGRRDASKISQRASALSALHAEYTDHPERYRKDAENRLVAFFEQNGGIKGMMDLDQQARDVREGRTEPGDEPPVEKPPKVKEFGEEPVADFRKAALKAAVSSPGIAQFTPSQSVRVGRDNLLVLLAERRSDGAVVVLGSTNDDEIIDAASLHARNYTLANLPTHFRVLVEAIRTQMYPAIALSADLEVRKAWEARHADRSHITTKELPGWDGHGKPEKIRANRKLLIRAADQSILLSLSAMRASVVTLCKPERGAFPYVASKPEPLHLETALRIRAQLKADPSLNEDELVIASGDYHYEPMRQAQAALAHKGMRLVERMIETTEIFSVNADDIQAQFPGYGKHKDRKTKHRWQINLQRNHEKGRPRLSFYDTWRDAGAVEGFQATFDFDGWKPDWEVSLEAAWFGQLREKLLDPWFSSLGKGTQPARASNRAMRLTLGDGNISFEFNSLLQDDSNNDSERAYEDMPWPNDHKASWLHLSRDIAPVLYNIADAEIVGTVAMSGNAHAVVISYATAVAKFSIAVPCAKTSRSGPIRDTTAFAELRYD